VKITNNNNNNNEIIFTLYFYKNKTPKTNSTLHQQIDNNKYKFRINLNEFQFNRCDKSYYLFNVCKIENESIVKIFN